MTSEPEKLLPVDVDRKAYQELRGLWGPKLQAALNAGEYDTAWDMQLLIRHRLSSPVSGTDMVSESFLAQLRRVNIDRYEAWSQGRDAGMMFDALELGGEVGELLNIVKKLEREARGWVGSRASYADFADECADVLICLDKLARRRGVDLEAATIAKFNATSDKNGFPHRLSASPSTPIPVIAEAGEREARVITRSTMVDLLHAIYRHHRWPVTLGRMAARANELYEITSDPGNNRYIATPRALSTPATLDNTAVQGQPVRVYLASRFSRRHECHALAQTLKAAGHSIASEWVQADQESVPVVGPSDTAAPEYRKYWGKLDLQNVRDCDWLISLQEPERSGGRGGRHVEFGIAAALDKRLTIIGPRETVFHHLPNVEHFDTVEAFVATLTAKTEKAE